MVELKRRQRHRWPGTNSNFPWRARCQRPQLSAPSMIFSRGRRSSAGPFLAILFAERVFSPLGMTSGPAFVSPLDSGCCFSVRVKKIDVGVQVARATTAHEFRRQPTIPFARWSRIVEAGDRFPQKSSFAPGDCSVQPPHLGSFATSLLNQIRTACTGRRLARMAN